MTVDVTVIIDLSPSSPLQHLKTKATLFPREIMDVIYPGE